MRKCCSVRHSKPLETVHRPLDQGFSTLATLAHTTVGLLLHSIPGLYPLGGSIIHTHVTSKNIRGQGAAHLFPTGTSLMSDDQRALQYHPLCHRSPITLSQKTSGTQEWNGHKASSQETAAKRARLLFLMSGRRAASSCRQRPGQQRTSFQADMNRRGGVQGRRGHGTRSSEMRRVGENPEQRVAEEESTEGQGRDSSRGAEA